MDAQKHVTINCQRYKNNSSNCLRNQKSDFKHLNLKCQKSSCRVSLQKNKRTESFFYNLAKCQDRIIATSQFHNFSKLLFYLLYGVVLLDTQAVVRRCSIKQVFLKFLQKAQKKHLCQSLFCKRDSDADVFLWIL